MDTPLQTSKLEERKQCARVIIAAMTVSFTSYTSFTADNILGHPPPGLYDELVWMMTYYKEIMEDETPLYHNGLPQILSFMPRTYGSW